MIIHSTTLDTMAKVIAIYGGTTWIQHTGYMLRGATSGVVSNSASATGGADSVKLSASQIPSLTTGNQSANHTHSISHTHTVSDVSNATWGNTFSASQGSGISGVPYSTTVNSASVSNRTTSTISTSTSGNNSGDHTHTYTNNNQSNVATLPQYKSVYIWERTA